jgi:carbon-monoxide dehydrogenase medium subunit
MYNFAYARPVSLEEAVEMSTRAEQGSFLAGGMTLIPALKLRLANPSHIIDLDGLDVLKGVKQDGNALVIGAMTTHAEVASNAKVRKVIPALADLAASIGDPQVRNRGTIGGSVANADPAADYPAGLVGLGATVQTNKRAIAADDFFTAYFDTALESNELITAVSFPIPKRSAYVKFPNPASRYAIVGVMVSETNDGVRLAVTGAGPRVFRIADMEQALAANFSPEAISGMTVSADGLNEDLHANAKYRAHLTTVVARRAVAAAAG